MRILAEQPGSMGSSETGPLTLKPMGQKGGGGTFSLILSYSFFNIRAICIQ